ncbi:aryl-alcohol dehydrogenase-like predicted oxidoreductase [Pullulanibacillus pueri]|uniref:General stress protein 69 n=1 Tax=Pullulanibacillus pueri TaxID=1437324 RepID=A0A8J2ZV18_9BACL|nr:aldo/keto reductase [Pullulanibacillus pueri]MBM7680770.1 aryl-alcohol dehydrogenase-like predicted oxidoreductase [Pullulanibacillus pueri]GGH78263.1 general stress protein 69 [Pullulanibacillus pueri]
MEFLTIERTNIRASRIGLGTWAIGGWKWGGSDEDQSIRTIHAAIDQGINLIDTAPAYGQGRSEEIVGKAIKAFGKREDIVIATKVGLDWTGEDVFRNGAKERIQKEIEDSLRRLQTHYIDIYQVHWPDPNIPIEETAQAMYDLYNEGKIRAIGVSNFSVEQLEAFKKTSLLHTVQPPYNLFEREIEKEILPWCDKNGVNTLLYGSLCRGLLSGKIEKHRQFTGDDLRNNDPKFQEPHFSQYLNAVKELQTLAQQRFGKTVLDLAVRWILDQPGASIALWGARRPDQVDPVNEMMDFNIDPETQHDIDAILKRHIKEPIGPEFMAPPARK